MRHEPRIKCQFGSFSLAEMRDSSYVLCKIGELENIHYLSDTVEDPEFPRRSTSPKKGTQTNCLAKFSWKRGGGGGFWKCVYVDPPLYQYVDEA